MKPKFSELLTPSSKLLASLVFAGCGLITPLASGQAVLDKTTFGSSQNDSRDLANSLIVPKRTNFGKEKKEEVDLKTLQTKSSKDTTFRGNLMDLDLDWRGGKMGKLGSGEKDSKGSKTADADGEKDSKVSKQADASGDRDPKASKSTQAGDDQGKDQKATSATSAEKTPEKEKASTTKPDPDR
jgi:hypothetical protein